MRKANTSSGGLDAELRNAPAQQFSSNDLEKELLALDKQLKTMPAHKSLNSTNTNTNDYYSYETESDDEELSDDSDEVDMFQLPKVYDAKDVDIDQLVEIQACCRGYLARRKFSTTLALRKERVIHVNDLASSEAVFVLSLQYLCTYFLAAMKDESVYKDDKIAQSMFSTLEELRAVDMDWLQSLQVLAANWNISSEIGPEAEKLISDFLPIYNFYCSNYLHMIHYIQQQMYKNPSFVKLEKKCCEELQRNTTIVTSLQVLLSLPLTNLRSYHVIFEQLLSCTEPDHVDYPKIQQCISQLKDVANLAATSVKDIENKQKILAMEDSLVGELPVKTWVAPNRIFILEGFLTKLCRKVAKRRHFWLLSDCLIYAIAMTGKDKDKEKDKEKDPTVPPSPTMSSSGLAIPPDKKLYKFRRMLPLLNSKFLDLADDPSRQPHAFQIVTAPKSFIVFANSEEQKREWLSAHETALSIISSRGTAVKVKTDTTEMAPIWLHDNMSTNCMNCRKSFNVVKRRHHCRKCGRLVCASCSQKKMMLSNLGKAKRVCDSCWRAQPPESPKESKSPGTLKNPLRNSKVLMRLSSSNSSM